MAASAPVGGFQLMGKTSLFSRVALSPGATLGGGKKADLANSLPASKGGKDLNSSINDADTMTSTTVNHQAANKTMRGT
jgi:hypothetical protein